MTGPTTPSPSERPAAALGRGGRMSRRRKLGAVPRPLRGEDLEFVSCKLGVTAARLTAWRDEFLAAGERDDRPQRRPGPAGGLTDDELAAAIRRALADSPFHGEGYRKVWARLRLKGVRTSKRRVLRLMGKHGLLSPQRAGRPHGPEAHDGTVRTDHVDIMWGTGLTSVVMDEGVASTRGCGAGLRRRRSRLDRVRRPLRRPPGDPVRGA